FSSSSNIKALHGTAKSLLLTPSTPPKDNTAYATLSVGTSIMMSWTFPRCSPEEFRTRSPDSVLADSSRRYRLSGSVFLIFFSAIDSPFLVPVEMQFWGRAVCLDDLMDTKIRLDTACDHSSRKAPRWPRAVSQHARPAA